MKAMLTLLAIFTASMASANQLSFRVYLDDKPIGYHRVEVASQADRTQVRVEAAFNVKFLFLTAYSYRHEAKEQWQGGCLALLDSETDDNGESLFVRAERIGSGVNVETPSGDRTYDTCVRSFAYWNPALLNASRLLNTQTGEFEPVERVDMGPDSLLLDGTRVSTNKFRLKLAEGRFIDLWYSPQGDWLALQSPLENGRVLSYYREGGLS